MTGLHASEDKKRLVIFVDKPIHRAIKTYASQTDQNMKQVLKEPIEAFQQSVLKMVSSIEAMMKEAERKKEQELELQKLASENPILVSGHEEDPLASETPVF